MLRLTRAVTAICANIASHASPGRDLIPLPSPPFPSSLILPLFLHLDHIALFVPATGWTETEWQEALKKKIRDKRRREKEKERDGDRYREYEEKPAELEEERKREREGSVGGYEDGKEKEREMFFFQRGLFALPLHARLSSAKRHNATRCAAPS